jgi:rhodanese-related sulfurtransferase
MATAQPLRHEGTKKNENANFIPWCLCGKGVHPLSMRELYRIAFQAFAVIAFSAGLALFVNAGRDNRLPLIMPFPPEYRCSSPGGTASPIETASALKAIGKGDTIFVDARSEEEFARGHIEKAVNIPYLFVEPISGEVISSLRKYERVIVYCNTKGAELSRLMAGELSHVGVKGAGYLEGGCLEWVRAGGNYTGQRPESYEDLR